MKISRRNLIVAGAALPSATLAGCGGGWKDDIPESSAPAVPGMTLLRTMTLDGTGLYRWGDGTKALQRTPVVPPDTHSTVAPKNKVNGWSGYIEFVQDPLGERGTVMLSSVDPSTPVLKNNRSEIYSFSEPAKKGSPAVRVYSYGVMVPSDSEFVAPDRFFSIQQLHDMPDPGDGARWPNMILMAGAGEFRVYLPLINPPAQDPMNRIAGRYPLTRNKWYDVSVHINISVEDDGWLKVYIDDNIIVDESGHATHYDDAEGPNFKLGVYNIFGHKEKYNPQTGKIASAYFSNCWHYAPA